MVTHKIKSTVAPIYLCNCEDLLPLCCTLAERNHTATTTQS
uniref:Uncharacterized protein n=1 Tax=Arundo donax TaxID=35708 RepID=A0A0A8Z230_ARUDO